MRIVPVAMDEDSLIREFFAPLAGGDWTFGLRDDAALLPELTAGERWVITSDTVVEGVHFFTADKTRDVAWKALAQNVSDLVAKAADPVGYSLALTVPSIDADWLGALTAGLAEAQSAFGMTLMGGDTTRGGDRNVLAITAFGRATASDYMSRLGAVAGDDLYVTGALGEAGVGLRVHPSYSGADALKPSQADRETALQRYLRPQPRLGVQSLLCAHASAAMDVSDGLLKDANRLARASGVAIEIKAPLDCAALCARIGAPELAFWGGDDYEVLFTVPEARAAVLMADAEELPFAVTRIGRCFDGPHGVRVVDSSGATITFDRLGYDHVDAG